MTPPLPLVGVRVIEVAQNLAGPFCTRILADMGAEVVKVEPPAGDAARSWGPPYHREDGVIFAFANTGKRSIKLNLATDAAMRVLARLVEEADVLVEALRPGTLDGMGMGWDQARRLNPRLIYTSVLAYGEEGPLSRQPGYEPLMQAHGGLLSYTGEPGGPPVRVGTSVVDMGTGMWAALGILAALRERERTGEGVRLSGSLFDTAVTWSGYHLLAAASDGTIARRLGTELSMIAPYGTFPTSDGEIMIAVGTDGLFSRLCRVLDLAEVERDPRYRHNPDRVAHREELNRAVAGATRELPAALLLSRLRAAGVPGAPVKDVGELLEDPQFVASRMMAPTPDGAGLNTVLPLRWDGERWANRAEVPRAGAHTREILEELGMDPGVIQSVLGETGGESELS
ncbi:MAG: CoA transferase [Gemmatimonadales bacterium]|nr:MAG: CoA transferase [Gemmatimonadales bacterium]